MIYAEAAELLKAAGLELERRSFGLAGLIETAAGPHRLQIGRASAGGDELSVKPPVGLVRWFHRPTLEELVALLIEAQRLVNEGQSPTLLDALLKLDPG